MENNRILVAIDGSQAATQALDKAIQLAGDRTVGLDLLHVIDTRQYHTAYTGALVDGTVLWNAEQRAEAELEDIAKPLQEAGLDVKIHIRFGSPRTVVGLDAPADYHTGLIVLGRSAKKLVSRMFIGSVASFVTANAPCDVLIVANPQASAN